MESSVALNMRIVHDLLPSSVRKQKRCDYILAGRTKTCRLTNIPLTAVSPSATLKYFFFHSSFFLLYYGCIKEDVGHLDNITRPCRITGSSQPQTIRGDVKTGAVWEGTVKTDVEAECAGSCDLLESDSDIDDEA